MKKFLSIIAIAVITVISICSCKKETPQFKFDLLTTGHIEEAKTTITADFSVMAKSDSLTFVNCDKFVKLEEYSNARDFIDDFAETNIISKMPNGVKYRFTIDGIIQEKVTGLSVEVHKTFEN